VFKSSQSCHTVKSFHILESAHLAYYSQKKKAQKAKGLQRPITGIHSTKGVRLTPIDGAKNPKGDMTKV
jgi:hypothetical protein